MMLSERELMFIIISSVHKEGVLRSEAYGWIYNKTIYCSPEFISPNVSRTQAKRYPYSEMTMYVEVELLLRYVK